MSMSFGSSKKKGSSSSKSNPWEPTIPALEGLVGQLDELAGSNVGATPDQLAAFDQLKANAANGNPYSDQITSLTNEVLSGNAVQSRSGDVESANADIQRRLGSIADGNNMDINENPYLQQVMQTMGDDIFNRIGAQFAGAGRDVTGNAAGQQAMSRGYTQAIAPVLFNQYNTERNNQMNAANTLYGAGSGSAQLAQGLDQSALGNQLQGVELSQAALDAQNYGPNTILNLEEQLKDLPAEDLALYTQLIGSIAGLGGQVSGKSAESGKSMGLGLNLLSDERMKEDKEQIGTLANGTPIYRFRYKQEDGEKGPMQIGVMAQEVEGIDPDAVTTFGGLKYVDYEEATDDAAQKMKKRKRQGGGNAYT